MSKMNNLTPHQIAQKFIDPRFVSLTTKDQASLLGISRSSVYYQLQPVDEETLDLMNRIDKLHTDFPFYGARKISKQITQDLELVSGLVVGRKRVRSLMERMGIEAIFQKPHLSENPLPHPIYPYLLSQVLISYPNQVWGVDITYIKLTKGFVYLVAVIDWYSRFVLSWRLSTSLEVDFVIEAVTEAISIYGNPEIVNVDQGVQFTSQEFIALWNKEKTKISMDHRGRCFDNIFTERFWRSLKYEEVYLKDYQSIREAELSIDAYIHLYNFKRLHQALEYLTPSQVYFGKTLLQDDKSRIVIPELVS